MIEACDGLPGEVAVAEVVPTRCVLDTRVPVSDYQKTVKKKNISKLIVMKSMYQLKVEDLFQYPLSLSFSLSPARTNMLSLSLYLSSLFLIVN